MPNRTKACNLDSKERPTLNKVKTDRYLTTMTGTLIRAEVVGRSMDNREARGDYVVAATPQKMVKEEDCGKGNRAERRSAMKRSNKY